jgi:hypothetical protein
MMMTDSTDSVNAFISDIKERLTPIARFELDALSKLKHAGLGSMNKSDAAGNEVEKITRFHTWDFSFTTTSPKVGTTLSTRRNSRNIFHWNGPSLA